MPDTVETKVEYRVKPITRYVITRGYSYEYADGKGQGGVEQKGEYDNADVAWEVAYALCKAEHERLGYPLDDERVQYPRHLHHSAVEADTIPA